MTTHDRAIDTGLYEVLWEAVTSHDRRHCRCMTPPDFDICGLCSDASEAIEALLDGEERPFWIPMARWTRMIRARERRSA